MKWREYQALQQVAPLGPRFLSYVDVGQGEPTVLLHGIPTWGYLWHPLLTALSRSGRVLVPDLLGFGYSDKKDTFDRSLAVQTDAIIAWLDRLGLARVNVVGHDLGGGLALRLAVLHPQRVARLALMNSVCYDSWPVEAMLQWGHPDTYRNVSEAAAQTMQRQMLKAACARSPRSEVLDGLVAPYGTEVGKLALVRAATALNTNLTTELTARLPQVRVPALVLWGVEDTLLPVRFGERLAADLRGANFVPVSYASHFVMLDQPEFVADELLRFLSS